MDGSNGKPPAGRIYFGSLEDVEARNRQAAAATAAAADPVPTPSQPKGTTLDNLSKHSQGFFLLWRKRRQYVRKATNLYTMILIDV